MRTAEWSEADVSMPLEEFARLRDPMPYFQQRPLSARRALSYARRMGLDVPAGVTTVEELMRWGDEEGRWTGVDNTYNWSYFGPGIEFRIVQHGGESAPGEPLLLIAAMHQGGDIRGNYGGAVAYYYDEADLLPWHGWKLVTELVTDGGKVLFESADMEGYDLWCSMDQTGTLEDNRSYGPDEVEAAFDFSGVETDLSLV